MGALKKYDLSGNEIGEVAILDEWLDITISSQAVKDYVVAIRKNARQWSANTKTKAEVNHTGKKPHAQKGMGRSRQGSLASPQYKGGGRVFGPRPKFDQHVRINRKERRAVISFIIAEKIKEGKVHVLDQFSLQTPRTKTLASFFDKINLADGRVLVVGDGLACLGEGVGRAEQECIFKSVRNIPKKYHTLSTKMSGYDLMLAKDLVILAPALDTIMALLVGKEKK